MKIKNCLIFLVTAVSVFFQSSYASDWEQYYECNISAPVKKESGINVTLREMVRCRENNLYFRKSFIGVSKDINKNLQLSGFFSVSEYKNEKWEDSYAVYPEIRYSYYLSRILILSNTKVERHITQKYWKLREKFRMYYPMNKRLTFWTGYECRHAVDKGLPLDYEYFMGLETALFKTFAINTYYDLRKIRVLGIRERTNCFRIMFDIDI